MDTCREDGGDDGWSVMQTKRNRIVIAIGILAFRGAHPAPHAPDG